MRALAVAVFLCMSCKPGDPKDPQAWLKGLRDSDAKARIKAVQELRKLKAKQAAPQVAALLKDQLVKEEAALALQDLAGPDEVQALIDAVDTTVGAGSDQATRVANRTNAKIAEALGNIGDARAGPTLLRLARANDDYVRLAAAQALGQVRAREAVPELARLVDDPAAPPILAKKAIVALGEIGRAPDPAHPAPSPAVSLGQMAPGQIYDPVAAAIPALEHGLVMERQGVSFQPESSFALFLIGAPAVEPLMKIAQDQDPAYLAWAKENNRAPAGTYAKAALVLGDLEDPRAVPVLLAKLKYVDPDPVPGTSRLLSNLVRQCAASALGRMRVKEAAAPILALVTTRDPIDEELTAFASEALVWIGDRSQARDLMKIAQQGGDLKLRLVVAKAAALFGEAALGKAVQAMAEREVKGGPSWCQKQLAELSLVAADPKQACDMLAAQIGELAQSFEAARICVSNSPCWLSKLEEPAPAMRARAAYELGRLGAPETVQPLVKAAFDDQLLVRRAATRALDWLASVEAAKPALKAAAAPLAAQLSAEQGKTQYFMVNEDVRRLQVKLSRL
jgi:HEAT repeat protein